MCDRCTKVREHAWHPHARLMLKQCAQREAMQRARAVLPVPSTATRPAEDPVWVSLLGIVSVFALFALAWIALP